ncbi:MAG TPA: YidC/Oxa1 family membrane protein insertase [Symbiobacteriaceae bacterium]|nr:YidC/Oxa1 family membrane protein insertase [Symbiobacteriaceae bacterium]
MSYLTSGIHAALGALFQLTGSYGWTILLLTLGIRLLLLPFAFWQQRSAKASAALQATAQEIQKQYRGEEAQRRLHPAPAGGCDFGLADLGQCAPGAAPDDDAPACALRLLHAQGFSGGGPVLGRREHHQPGAVLRDAAADG